MNCADWERLIDAYLDRQLAGSLRLEFDAHRLRCRRCQQTLAMMEACEHVLSTDEAAPPAAPGFTDAVLARIAERRPAGARGRGTRLVVVVGGVLQAAAVLMLAILFHSQRATPPPDATTLANAGAGAAQQPLDEIEQHERAIALIAEKVRRHIDSAGSSLSTDAIRLAQYLNVDLPDEVAPSRADFANGHPIGSFFLHLLTPPDYPAAPRPEAPPAEASEQIRL